MADCNSHAMLSLHGVQKRQEISFDGRFGVCNIYPSVTGVVICVNDPESLTVATDGCQWEFGAQRSLNDWVADEISVALSC
jgi:hypothetical protein